MSSLASTRSFSRTGATVAVTLLLCIAILLAAGAIPAARAAPTLVEQASGGGSGTSYTVTLTGVTAGDLIVVAESEGYQPGCDCTSFPITVTDTQSNGYVMVVQEESGLEEASVWYTTASSGGTDVITVTLTGCQTNYADNTGQPYNGCGNNGAVAYELSGFTYAGVAHSTGAGSAGCCSVGSFTPPAGSFVVAAAGVAGYVSPWTAGGGYTLSANDSPNGQAQAEYLEGWGSGSTTAPISSTLVAGDGNVWAEAAAAFPVEPVVTTTSTSTVTTTQTVTEISTIASTVTSTQLSTTTVTSGSCPGTASSSIYGSVRQYTVPASPTITVTTSTTVTTTAVDTTTTTATNTATTTITGTVTATTCQPSLPPPTGVPQFPLGALGVIMLVALLLPALALLNKRRATRPLV